MAILQKYGILTNPAYDEGAQDSPPVEQAPVQAAPPQAPQQPIPTIRQQQPAYRPNPLRMAQERGLQQSLLRQENRPAPSGFWGKAGHILSNVANAAGNVILGGANMAMIPGTQQNAAAQHTATMGELQGLEKQDQQEEQQFGQEQLRGAQAHEAEARAGSLENPPDKPDKFSFQQTDHGLMRIDSVTGEATPVTFNGQVLQPKPAVEKDTKITEDLQNQIDAANQAGDTAKVQQLQKRLRDLNPGAEQRLAVTVANGANRPPGRMYSVLDTQDGNRPIFMSAADLSSAPPGRYVTQSGGQKALGQTALIEDIRGNIKSVRDVLKNPQMPEFSADQRAALAIALGNQHAGDAVSTAIGRGGVLGSLTPEQQDFAIAMAQLKENAMAMRSVLGAGQGSDELRAAILATLPSSRNPSKQYGLKQLDAFEKVLGRLERGIPKVGLRNDTGVGSGGAGGDQPTRPANVPEGYLFKDGPKGKGWYKP